MLKGSCACNAFLRIDSEKLFDHIYGFFGHKPPVLLREGVASLTDLIVERVLLDFISEWGVSTKPVLEWVCSLGIPTSREIYNSDLIANLLVKLFTSTTIYSTQTSTYCNSAHYNGLGKDHQC